MITEVTFLDIIKLTDTLREFLRACPPVNRAFFIVNDDIRGSRSFSIDGLQI
jgi:hypothetical protein